MHTLTYTPYDPLSCWQICQWPTIWTEDDQQEWLPVLVMTRSVCECVCEGVPPQSLIRALNHVLATSLHRLSGEETGQYGLSVINMAFSHSLPISKALPAPGQRRSRTPAGGWNRSDVLSTEDHLMSPLPKPNAGAWRGQSRYSGRWPSWKYFMRL